jgi:phosphoglycerate dehydrogenase-like enzyme
VTPPLRIVHLEPLPEWIQGLYENLMAESELSLEWAGHVPDDALADAVAGAHVLVTGKRAVDGPLMAAAGPNLRFIQVVGRAPWSVDPAAAYREGVQVSVVPHNGAIAVAEHTMALMLGVMRQLAPGHAGTRDGTYRDLGLEPEPTDERNIAYNWLSLEGVRLLHGKRLGLVGLGHIGLEVTRRAQAFDMEVHYHKRHRLPAEHERLADVTYAPFDELLAQSDVVSLHVPHTSHTEGLVDAAALGRMKPTAALVNTARGGLVDEAALVRVLREGRIAGAGLDVFVDEPVPADHPLLTLDNVLLAPHIGGAGGTGQKGSAAAVIANLERLARDETPGGLVTP